MTTASDAIPATSDAIPATSDAIPATTDAIPAATDVEVVARGRRWQRVVAAFGLGLLGGLLLIVIGLLAWDSKYDGRVLPGVHAEGVDLSGLDRDAARAALSDASARYGDGRIVLQADGARIPIPYDRVGRGLDLDVMVDEAMAIGRSGTPLERAVGQVRLAMRGATVEPSLTLDDARLDATMALLLRSLERAPVDATIRMTAKGIETTPASVGRRFDIAAAGVAAHDAASRVDAPAEVVIPVAAVDVPPARSDADVLAARANAERVATDVQVKYGSRSWTLPAATVRTWTRFENAADGSITLAIDEAAVAKSLGAVAKGVARPAVSASYLTGRNGKIVGATPSADGRQLDTKATAAAIADALEARAGGGAPAPVGARVTAVAPKLTTEEARKTAPLMVMLGSWKTWFPISERNHYGANIWIPALTINGTVLAPGQRFEWWSAIGPVTAARGYGMGGIIKSDHTDPTGAIGGGMCSSSTTLFNAALRAGLQMGARSNHKYYINRYPLGLDATVSGGLGGGQTMSFTNDMSHPIYIRGIKIPGKVGGKGWVRYEIWGIPDGRTVSLSRPAVSNVLQATTNIVYVSSLPHGVRQQTEFPADGMNVSVTRTVRSASGQVIHRETYFSHYVLWNGRIEVGL